MFYVQVWKVIIVCETETGSTSNMYVYFPPERLVDTYATMQTYYICKKF